ncbi:TPA: DUF2628 domain-containing protein [Streptococcus suis]|nr:DUF2628 domain-containing protein [Streptococcus suis]
MKINLTNEFGQIKQAPLGFSWTTFFFTMWVAVFRKDWKWAGIMFAANALIGTLASQFDLGYLVFAVNIVMGFLYNKLYLKELQKKGWKPATDSDAELIRTKGQI